MPPQTQLSGQVPSNNSRVVIATPRQHIVDQREHSATATMISLASLEVVDLLENTMMVKTGISTGLLLLRLSSILSVGRRRPKIATCPNFNRLARWVRR